MAGQVGRNLDDSIGFSVALTSTGFPLNNLYRFLTQKSLEIKLVKVSLLLFLKRSRS